MKFLKIIGLSLLALIIVLVCVVTFTGWILSASVSDETNARIAKSQHFEKGKFVNTEPEAGIELGWKRISDLFAKRPRQEPAGAYPVVQIDMKRLQSPPTSGLRMSWLGHATVLIEIDGKRILTDPVFSERVSPFSFAGPRRFHPTPIELDKLTGIDAVVVSHNHYDHLDKATVQHLARQNTRFFVPLGNKPELVGWGVPEKAVIELDWWQEADLGELKIVATPARHYSSRGAFDYQETLWASWTIIGPTKRIFFSGDTGYSKAFSDIGQRLGPFDATIIKVGAYGPGAMWHDIHMPPKEAIQVNKDVRGAAMLPVHWGTFDLADHEWDEPIIRTVKLADQASVKLLTPKVGEFVDPSAEFQSSKWWEKVD